MTYRQQVADPAMPPCLPMGATDLAYQRAMRGRPLPTGILFGFAAGPPPLDAVRTRVAERAPHIPALRYRIARDRRHLERVDEIAVEDHVREISLPGDADGTEAGRLLLTRPLPAGTRPPWEVWLIRGSGGGYTLCLRTDHTMLDGVGTSHTARALLDDRPAPATAGPAPHLPSRPAPRGLGRAFADIAGVFRSPGPRPAFAAPPSGEARLCHADTPLTRLRGIGRTFGGTVNDVYLAALAHAVRTWHLKETGRPHPPLPVAVPMSLRTAGERYAPGNRMVTARLMLPCDEESPVAGLARIMARTSRLRRYRERDAWRVMLAATPASVSARLGSRMVNGETVAAPTSGVHFGDALVHHGAAARDAAVFTALAAGLRCFTALTGHGDNARLTVIRDEALVGADALPDLWLAALVELEQA